MDITFLRPFNPEQKLGFPINDFSSHEFQMECQILWCCGPYAPNNTNEHDGKDHD